MLNELRPAVVFSAIYLAVLILLATGSVYMFGQYERAWGRGGSWQVLSWIAIGSTILAFFAALFTSTLVRRRGRELSITRAALASILTILMFLPLSYVAAPIAQTVGLLGVAVASLVLPALSCALLSKSANSAPHRDGREAAAFGQPSSTPARGRER